LRILVVEDSLTMRRIIIDALRAMGATDVVEAPSAEQGYETLCNTSGIGLVLLDFHLPGMSGLDLLRMLRQNQDTAHVPVVMVTSVSEKPSVIAALRAGARDFIVKPFTHNVFKKKIGPLLDAPPDAAAESAGRLVGSLGQTSPLEVIQLISMTKKTGVLELQSPHGTYSMHFRDGQIQHAAGPQSQGEDAVGAAAALSEGVFTFKTEAAAHPVTVRRSTEMLMLDALNKPAR
jgi:two-component system chemotaxis response regulator CheY